MSKTTDKTSQTTDEVAVEVTPEEQSQVAVWKSADTDPATGAEVIIGVPERSDEEEVGDFIVLLQTMAEEANADSMKILAENLRRSASVEDIRQAVAEPETINGKDIVGVPFLAHGFTIHEGQFEDSDIPFYASIDATRPDGTERRIINCGGSKILVHLITFQRIAEWPLPLVITGKQTRKGYTVLSFDYLG